MSKEVMVLIGLVILVSLIVTCSVNKTLHSPPNLPPYYSLYKTKQKEYPNIPILSDSHENIWTTAGEESEDLSAYGEIPVAFER